jgi:hypothetical protein
VWWTLQLPRPDASNLEGLTTYLGIGRTPGHSLHITTTIYSQLILQFDKLLYSKVQGIRATCLSVFLYIFWDNIGDNYKIDPQPYL